MKIKIGTRGSRLAMIQSEYVRNILADRFKEHQFILEIIHTKGDRIQDRPLDKIGSNGVFVREIEDKIIKEEIQIGVHSMKDLPAVLVEGLVLTKAWIREDPRDVLILREKKSLAELEEGAVIGTGSKRRAFQLLKIRPDLQIVNIRGNVDTRLHKMEEQKLDGIVLAAAGMHRLGMKERITSYLEPEEMIPSPTQGILGLEVKASNKELIQMLDVFADEETENMAIAERTFLSEIGADCHMPIGAFCRRSEKQGHRLDVVYGNESGENMVSVSVNGDDPIMLAKGAAREVRKKIAGTVYLVGGGPGDEDLITVKGRDLIREADCIIYDRLSSPELLSYAKEACEQIYVGKANHHHTMKQEQINALLVTKAMQYKKVVRLKGGDVFVFGRGGEEAIALFESGVPFEVVPGISSAIAGLAYAGIPITQRGVAGGFHVVTAHDKDDKLAAIDFKAMASSKDTCVFMMGLNEIENITKCMMEAGKDPTTGAAVISCATTPEQRVCQTELQYLSRESKKANLVSPALIVIGDVVKLRGRLGFEETAPLSGKKYLVPKIGIEISELAKRLRKEGASVKEITVGQIETIDCELSVEAMKRVSWIVFTSKNAIDAFFLNLYRSGLDSRNLFGIKFAVIGQKTQESLLHYGIKADKIPLEYHSEALADMLMKEVRKSDVVWYPKAESIDNNLKKRVSEFCTLEEIPMYRNLPPEKVEIPEEFVSTCDGVFFTCASSVYRVMKALQGKLPVNWKNDGAIVSIGPKCSAAIIESGITNFVQADHISYEGMVQKIIHKEQR